MQQLIVTYGLIAIFVLMAAESACIPVPSEVTMLLGGALAAGAVSGVHPNVLAVIGVGTAGNVAGSYLAWLVGRYGGRPVLHRWARFVLLRPSEVDRAQDWFARRGSLSVLWARLLPGIRTFISLPAGIAAMPPIRFGVYTLAGCLPWTAALTVAGYTIGANWHVLEQALRGPSYVITAIAVMSVVAAAVVAVRRRRRKDADEAESGRRFVEISTD
ncbi:putative membrane-associated protein [Mycolicibacterium chubuense NBB4]|uniref:Putative membrane-associated protein n=1 Tax=Mycolicibacterium chubuense (strain NBB4) TaxID=710421 RepID=I4BIA2_MYCCN|nr:DedA family protein [Mycolicibacterium chubuense]AFM17009.1 putative membrane-associated protein [Mycolicibacterium chubuense NBB4]